MDSQVKQTHTQIHEPGSAAEVQLFKELQESFARQFENAAEKARNLIDIQPCFWGGIGRSAIAAPKW